MYQFRADRQAVFTKTPWDVTWKADIGAKSNGGLSVVGDTILVESFDKGLYAFDALTGRRRWRAPLPDIAMGAPIVANGLVIAGTGHDEMAPFGWAMQKPKGDEVDAFDLETGRKIWSFHTTGEDMPTGVYLMAGHVPEYVFSNGDDHAYALEISTGRLRWRSAAMGINAMSDLATDGRAVYGIAEYSWRRLFDGQGFSSDSPSKAWVWTWSLNPANGWFNWRAPFGVADGGVTLAHGRIFLQNVRIGDPAEALAFSRKFGWLPALQQTSWITDVIALDARTGKVLWRYTDREPNRRSSKTSGTFSTTGTLAGDVLYEPLQISRHIAAFDPRTGRVLWKIATLAPVKMALTYDGGRIYAGDTDGNFYVIKAANGEIERRLIFPAPFTPSPPVIAGNTLFVVNGRTLYALRVSDLDRGIAPVL